MENLSYKIYVRVANPCCCIKIAEFQRMPSDFVLDAIARNYSEDTLIPISSIEIHRNRKIIHQIDF